MSIKYKRTDINSVEIRFSDDGVYYTVICDADRKSWEIYKDMDDVIVLDGPIDTFDTADETSSFLKAKLIETTSAKTVSDHTAKRLDQVLRDLCK